MSIAENGRPFTIISVNGAESLSSALPGIVGSALDEAEDLGPATVVLVHVVGSIRPSEVKAWPGPVDLSTVSRWERVLRRLERAPSTTIAFLEHACSQVALELLMVADRRIASASFSILSGGPDEDIWPSMALYRLCRQIGESRTRQFLLDRTPLTADRAINLGIIDTIRHDAGHNSQPTAQQFLPYAPPSDYPVSRRLLQDCVMPGFDDSLGAHLAACDRTLRRNLSYQESTRCTWPSGG
jgi:isomerase DpgB